ncbi:unnamed protein product, partial [Rotaria magnacalcarata]
ENINYQYSLSDNETDDQQEPILKRRKQTSTTTTITTAAAATTTNESSNGLVKFSVDFFESCHLLTDYEFGGRDLL